MVGGQDEQVALRVQRAEPLPHGRVDPLQRAVEARHVLAMAVDLVGLDEVGEDEPAVERVDQRARRLHGDAGWSRPGARGRRPRRRTPARPCRPCGRAGPSSWTSCRYERAGGGSARSLRPSVRAKAPGSPANGRAITRPTACSPLHDLARRRAGRVELLDRRHLVHVGGDLEHRVGRRVDDQVAGLEMLLAEVLDHLGAAVGAVAEDPAAGRVVQLVEDLVREAVRVGAQRDRRDHPHQLPVAGDRVLAGPDRVQAAVQHGVGRRAGRRPAAAPSRGRARPSTGRSRPPDGLGDVAERVGPGVAVVARCRAARPRRRRRARSRRPAAWLTAAILAARPFSRAPPRARGCASK